MGCYISPLFIRISSSKFILCHLHVLCQVLSFHIFILFISFIHYSFAYLLFIMLFIYTYLLFIDIFTILYSLFIIYYSLFTIQIRIFYVFTIHSMTPQTRGSVDYPSTPENTCECRVTRHFSRKSGIVSFVRGALPKYKTCIYLSQIVQYIQYIQYIQSHE